MSTNGKVSHLLIVILIRLLCLLAPTAGTHFTPNTILLYIFCYLKTVALIILNKTESHKEDRCLKIYAYILAILFCYLNLQHLKKHKILDQNKILDQVSTESTFRCCARSCQRSDK